jgi:GTP pyrophosphokinase
MCDVERIRRALEFATLKHKGQKRIGGNDYITHPIAVYEMVKKQGYGEDFQITALFHDLLEDTDATEDEILKFSNKNVLTAVKLLTKEKGYEMQKYIDGGDENEI